MGASMRGIPLAQQLRQSNLAALIELPEAPINGIMGMSATSARDSQAVSGVLETRSLGFLNLASYPDYKVKGFRSLEPRYGHTTAARHHVISRHYDPILLGGIHSSIPERQSVTGARH